MGQAAAEIATRKILDFGANSLLVIGTCGALSPLLKPGDIVLPETVMTDSQVTMLPTSSWHQSAYTLLSGLAIPIHTQSLLSIGRVLSRSVEKNQIYLDTGAVAVDMESAAIMKVALSKQVPVLILRTVIDPSDFSIPDFVLKNSDAFGDTHTYPLLKSCIVNPLRLGTLFRLAGYYGRAKSTLMTISARLNLLEFTTRL